MSPLSNDAPYDDNVSRTTKRRRNRYPLTRSPTFKSVMSQLNKDDPMASVISSIDPRFEGLTDKQAAFVLEYVSNGFNATKAALDAGYTKNKAAASVAASRDLLDNPKIRRAVTALLKERIMSREEIAARLSDLAKADIAQFIEDDGRVNIKKSPGKTYVIRRYRVRKGESGDEVAEIELHDSQRALETLAKITGLLGGDHKSAEGGVTVHVPGGVLIDLLDRLKSGEGGDGGDVVEGEYRAGG